MKLKFIATAATAQVIGVCMTPYAAADYSICTPVPPLFTSVQCTQAASPPNGYVCSGNTCYPRNSTNGQAILNSQQPPKPGDRKSAAAPKTTNQPPSSSNLKPATTTVKTLSSPPPPGAMKQPCPTPGRC